MDPELKAAAEELYQVAYKFYNLMHERRLAGGTVWVTYGDGAMFVFTRGEYKAQLMYNIETTFDKDRVHSFGLVEDR